jgi:hypothetical protein
MIQRIQTIYLVLLFLFNGIGIFLNHSIFSRIEEGFVKLDVLSLDIVFVILAGLVILLSIITIFNYKNRRLQMHFCQIMITLNLFFIIIIGVYVYRLLSLPGGFNFPKKGIEWIITFISIVFAILAKNAIRSDDELVKSADRFR